LAAKIRAANIERNVVFISDLADDEMPLLYNGALALVFPSFCEGGGIPVMEAMACGCPVAASDIPAIRESGGDAIRFFDPNKVESISAAVLAMKSDPEARKRLTEKGLVRADAFCGSTVADKLVSVYKEALAAGGRH
jgi:glycosyltransferase involved in cell wall biosynthesis